MGQDQHKFTNDSANQIKSLKIIPQQYKVCYSKWLEDQHYLNHLMTQNQLLTSSIIQLFPHARKTYDNFLQMVLFLRSYDPYILVNDYAKYNAQHTTVLDRFFMVILKLQKYEMLNSTMINTQKMQSLFMELMKIFIPNPKRGFMVKLKKFIGLKQIQTVSLKQFSASLRQYLPHIQKHIKDYYVSKFNDMQFNGHLLRHFKSEILQQDAVILSMKVGQLTLPTIRLLYQPRSCGMSFAALQKNLIGYTGPWLILIEHLQKDSKGEKNYFKFGSYQSGPIRDVTTHQGDPHGFLFQLSPKIRHYGAVNEGSHFYILNNRQTGKLKRGLGFGGNAQKQHFKLWIDQDIDKSTVYNGVDETYGFGSLVTPNTTDLNIIRLEVWGLGSREDQENQTNYWAERQIEIQKRRKVNKQQFAQDNGMLFQNTFAHREQGYQRGQRNKDQNSLNKRLEEHYSQKYIRKQ